LLVAIISLATLVVTFPFHRLLLGFVVSAFAEGFVGHLKRRRWKVSGEKPPKVTVSLFGMKLTCSPTSITHRIRNILNSLPNDRDFEEHFARHLRAIRSRRDFFQHSFCGVRHGGHWSGPLLVKWSRSTRSEEGYATGSVRRGRMATSIVSWGRPALFLRNLRALTDRYRARFVVIAPGILRVFKGARGEEDSYHAAEGHDSLALCAGWLHVPGGCLTLHIQGATVAKATTRYGFPSVHLAQSGRGSGHPHPAPKAGGSSSSWCMSFSCNSPLVQKSVLEAFERAGCRVIAERTDVRKRRRKTLAASFYE